MIYLTSLSLIRSIAYAKAHHAGQKRETGEPYILHALHVVNILQRHGLDEETLIAAALHDVTEDTDSTNLDIDKEFGGRAAAMVYALSKCRKPDAACKDAPKIPRQADTRLGFYLLGLESLGREMPGVIFIKMADQIDNLQTLDVFPPEKQARKIREIEEDFLPLFDRVAVGLDSVLRDKFEQMRRELVRILEDN